MLVIAILAFAGAAFAQNSSTVTGVQSHARIIRPISISKCSDLNFGNILAASTSGTVVVSNTFTNNGGPATQTYSNPNMKPGNQNGPFSNACFCVAGECGWSYTESHPSTLTVTNGAVCVGPGCVNTMSVALSSANATGGSMYIGTDDNDPSDPDDCIGNGDPNLGGEGEISCFHIGGTLSVGPTNGTSTQNVGNYSGTWTEMVSY